MILANPTYEVHMEVEALTSATFKGTRRCIARLCGAHVTKEIHNMMSEERESCGKNSLVRCKGCVHMEAVPLTFSVV